MLTFLVFLAVDFILSFSSHFASFVFELALLPYLAFSQWITSKANQRLIQNKLLSSMNWDSCMKKSNEQTNKLKQDTQLETQDTFMQQ